MNEHNSNYLAHYGVKGMKWGIRKEYKPVGRRRSKQKQETDKIEKRKGLTDKQKKAIKIGAAAVGTGLAIYGGYKVYQLYKGDPNQLIDPITGFRMLSKDTDTSDISPINPGRIKFLSTNKNKEIINGSSTNCMLCTTAYELRQRGYDVHAGLEKKGTGYMPDELFPKIYENYKGTTKLSVSLFHDSQMEEITKYINNEGSGSRGNIMVWWQHGGGHSMIWENVNGKIIFKDGQTGKIYKNFEREILRHTETLKPIEMLRTDNLTLNTSQIKDYVNPDNIVKTYVDHGGEIALNMATDPVVQLTGYAGWVVGQGVYGTHKNRKAIKAYRISHPNTKMTNAEIAKMLASKK